MKTPRSAVPDTMPVRQSTARVAAEPEPGTPVVAEQPAPAGIERIVLTGFMGSGKTTVGLRLAEHLSWRFVDLDHEIERRDGRSVPVIFASSGEAHFRQLETAALADLLLLPRIVLALGGGAPEQPASRRLLEQASQAALVYLFAPLETLLERCRKDVDRPGSTSRPLLLQAPARFAARYPHYERLADYRIETQSLDVEQTVTAIIRELRIST
jgi:shikimate kinase